MPPKQSKKVSLKKELDLRRPENVGRFDATSKYAQYDPLNRLPDWQLNIPTTGYELEEEPDEEEETLLSKQVKNAVNTYFNEREEPRFTAKYMKKPINNPIQSLDTEGPVFVHGHVAKRNFENMDYGQLNAGSVYKNKPKIVRENTENFEGFVGNNYNANGLKNQSQQRLTKAEIKKGIVDPRTKQPIPRKYTGKVSDATILKENPKPSGLTWYTRAVAEYKKQKRAENAFYSGRIRKGTQEYNEVMAIAEKLKNS